MSLKAKVFEYAKMIRDHQDEHGFILTDRCDSLLFSALIGCNSLVRVNIDAAMGFEGEWYRRPLYNAQGELWAYPECYACGESKSTISRDMLLGLAWYAYYNKRLDISEGIIKYAFRHGMVMGKGVLSRTLMTPSLLATFAWVSYRLGGPSRSWLRWIPADFGAKVTDYQAHLQCLHILLRKKLGYKLNPLESSTLSRLASENPWNVLFQVADGRVDDTIELLECENWWPNDRLPTTADRKGGWLPERDWGDNYKPSDGEPRVHTGGDFLFVAWLLSLT
jgi:hypothetical protein